MSEKAAPALWRHQEEMLESLSHPERTHNVGLFWEPGTGKTRGMVEILRRVYNSERAILPTLILAPKVVVSNWRSEILRYSAIPEDRVVLLTGPGDRRVKDLLSQEKPCIFVTNYEALQNERLFKLLVGCIQILVCDESQRVKTFNSRRTKLTTQLADRAKYRYILTGTPVLNSQMDLFAQMRILDRGKALGSNYYAFRAQYFYDKNAGMPKHNYFPDWRPRPDTTDKLTALIASKVSIAKKEECLDLPPLVEKVVEVEMAKDQARFYNEMKNDLVTYLGSEACVASLAITKALRLQQIVSGYLRTEEMRDVVFEDTPREQALTELLDDLTPNHKVIVWGVFHANYSIIERVCEKLGVKCAWLTGKVSDKDKQIDLFRNHDDYRVMGAHPNAGGVGVNLIEASQSVVFSRSFSLEQDLQSKARNYRGGSERHEKITRTHLVTPGTIDKLVFDALTQKQDLANKIMSLKALL